MGQSTDGILAYGVLFGDPENEEKLPACLYLAAGVDKESGLDDDELLMAMVGEPPWDLSCEGFDVFKARRKRALDSLGVEIVSHCSGEYPMYILAAQGTYYEAGRGVPEKLTPEDLVVSPEQKQKLIDFCERIGFELAEDNQPAWRLASYWG